MQLCEWRRSKRIYTVTYERSDDGFWAWVVPARGKIATTVGVTRREARKNIRMSLADLLDCGDYDFKLKDA